MGPLDCRADNPACPLRSGKSVLQSEAIPILRCDVCCAEPGFCSQCKCILCSRVISPTDESIQCLQKVSASNAGCCGHCAHLRCAVQCRLAGVVDDAGLDVEYLCRRCDRNTDLVPRLSILVKAVAEAPTSQLAEAYARLAASLVSNTRRAGLKRLETIVRSILVKAENGDDIQAALTRMCNEDSCNGSANHDGASGIQGEVGAAPVPRETANEVLPTAAMEVGKAKDNVVAAGEAMEVDKEKERDPAPAAAAPHAQGEPVSAQSTALVVPPQPPSDGQVALPVESVVRHYQQEIDRALADLKRAQEQEYAAARDKLAGQMERILGQYQLLESDRCLQPSSNGLSAETYDAFMEKTMAELGNLKKERDEFERMLGIGQGFGRVPKELLRDSFNWPG